MTKKTYSQFSYTFFLPHFWPTWLLLGIFWCIAQLPLAWSQTIGRGLGRLFFRFSPSRRMIAETNVRRCFPELSKSEQDKIIQGSLVSCGLSIAETAIALWGNEDKVRGRYSISGLEHIEKAQAEGKGILLCGSHLTTIDISGRIFSYHGTADVLYRSASNPLMSYAVAKARSRVNANAIHRNDTRQLIKNLRQGHIVWYAPDQNYKINHSIFAPFFGIPAATIVATSRIAKLSHCAVIPFFCYREPNGRYSVEIHPALENFPTDDDLADATRINNIIETAIRKAPEQYLWIHRRFKTRPPGEPEFYPKKSRRKNR